MKDSMRESTEDSTKETMKYAIKDMNNRNTKYEMTTRWKHIEHEI